MESISVGLLGLGTVGSGVVKVIQDHQDKLAHQIGCPVYVKKALVLDVNKERNLDLESGILTANPYDVIQDPEIDIVVEVMGGIESTKEYLVEALKQKKHIVTANKDLMAVHGPELLALASENQCDLFYEASVAGGIPILRSLVDGLSSDRITKMMGIVNGTTNYILTKMSKQGLSFDDVLAEAQRLGFAEADPSSDVDGIDAARKMAILSTLGFSMNVGLGDVKVSGIRQVAEEDLRYCDQLGYTMKLIGYAHRQGEKIEVSVEPTLLENSHPLSAVNDEYNAVYVYGEAVGETMFYGPGAGSLPTATAVVSDLVAIMKNMRLGVNGKSAVIPQFPKKLKDHSEIISKYFLRLHVEDEVGVLANITSIFSKHGVGFEKIMQNPVHEQRLAEVVLVTHQASLEAYENTLVELRDLGPIREVKSSYRVEGGK